MTTARCEKERLHSINRKPVAETLETRTHQRRAQEAAIKFCSAQLYSILLCCTHARTLVSYSLTHSITYALTHENSLIHSLNHSLTHSLTHSRTLTHTLTHSFTGALTNSLAHAV